MDKTVHSVRSLGESHGEKDGYPISQAVIGADGQFLPIRSDHLQYPSYVVSRSEGNKWIGWGGVGICSPTLRS